MTHDELLAKIDEIESVGWWSPIKYRYPSTIALRAVVELHKPVPLEFVQLIVCKQCAYETGEGYDYDMYSQTYPCKTIQAIEKELSNG